MKCYKCNGTGYYDIDNECPVCDGTGEYEPFDADVELDKLYPTEQTNEEWLRQASTEQLAEWLVEHIDCASCCCKKDLCCKDYDSCKLTFVEWLKQPHKPIS